MALGGATLYATDMRFCIDNGAMIAQAVSGWICTIETHTLMHVHTCPHAHTHVRTHMYVTYTYTYTHTNAHTHMCTLHTCKAHMDMHVRIHWYMSVLFSVHD